MKETKLIRDINELTEQADLEEEREAAVWGSLVAAFFMIIEPERRHRCLSAWLLRLTELIFQLEEDHNLDEPEETAGERPN